MTLLNFTCRSFSSLIDTFCVCVCVCDHFFFCLRDVNHTNRQVIKVMLVLAALLTILFNIQSIQINLMRKHRIFSSPNELKFKFILFFTFHYEEFWQISIFSNVQRPDCNEVSTGFCQVKGVFWSDRARAKWGSKEESLLVVGSEGWRDSC